MKLYIDTSKSDEVSVRINQTLRKQERKEKSESLLALIDCSLRESSTSLECIEAIEAKTGPGSFTGLRVGFAVANLLAWYFKIPFNGKIISQEGLLPAYLEKV